MKKIITLLFLIQGLIIVSCSEIIEKENFNSPLAEPCMILNSEQDNTIEGNYIVVERLLDLDSSIYLKIPKNFFINKHNCENWVLGWGTNIPLYDAGSENIREIKTIDSETGQIYLGKVKRGAGFPEEKQRIVFWNTNPSGFSNNIKEPIINPKKWPQFSGESISFSSVEYDSLLSKWVMIINECDTSQIQIYAAVSDNLIDWKPSGNGSPILTASDFEKCNWAGIDKTGKIPQTPFVSDIVPNNNKWYLFLDGYSSDGQRHIGVAISETTLLGPYKVYENPILSPGKNGSWNDKSVFYGKVKKYKEGFMMVYDGRNSKGYERIGIAFSKNLINWTNSENNPVLDQHTGWRSSVSCTEPSYIEIKNDSILVMVAGAKKFKMGPWHHYITKRMYLDKSGNVDDAQLGIYLSIDGGKTFKAHINNPIFTNDYSNKYENGHVGGNFKIIKTDTANFLFYQAKSSYQGLKYNVLLRVQNK
tara:strand:- start:4749 stop:6176 length:1428 start_codon:yes stop_codon:yes gene_type:complete